MSAIKFPDNLRHRAIMYARSQQFDIGNLIQRGVFAQMTPEELTEFRVNIDNLIAAGVEMGYAMALDDARPARALRDPQRSTAGARKRR